MTTPKPRRMSQAQQNAIDAAVAAAVAAAKTALVQSESKPQLQGALRSTWRKSAEHKASQIKLFLSTLAGLVFLQAVGDLAVGKDLSHLTDARALWSYLLPVALIAWRQLHPALTASQVDSAPGVTIVPSQVTTDMIAVDLPADATVEVAAGPEGDAAR